MRKYFDGLAEVNLLHFPLNATDHSFAKVCLLPEAAISMRLSASPRLWGRNFNATIVVAIEPADIRSMDIETSFSVYFIFRDRLQQLTTAEQCRNDKTRK